MEKENSEFKPVKVHLKIDVVSYPARAEGLVIMNKGVLRLPQSSSITGNLLSDCLVTYPGHALGRVLPFLPIDLGSWWKVNIYIYIYIYMQFHWIYVKIFLSVRCNISADLLSGLRTLL